MINRWLENEPKETLVCAVTSAIALVLSITGILKDVLPFDIAWAAIGNAAKYGIIVRPGDALERLSKIRRIAFDKTGMLTYGKPRVTAVMSTSEAYSDEEVLRIAALTEQKSEHPLGKAIWTAYEKAGGKAEEAEDFRVLAGQGVSAVVDGKRILAGKEGFLLSVHPGAHSKGIGYAACSRTEAHCFPPDSA